MSCGVPSCSITPPFISAIVSAIDIASSWSCVTYTVVALQAVVQRAQLAAHHLAELRVQCAERLVEQERQGLADDRAAQRDALAVAARESRHRAVQQIGDPQNPRRLLDALPYLVAPHALASQRIGDVRAHVHVRVEREELEHERDVALRCPLEGHVLAAQQQCARMSAARARRSSAASSSCRSPRARAGRRNRRRAR